MHVLPAEVIEVIAEFVGLRGRDGARFILTSSSIYAAVSSGRGWEDRCAAASHVANSGCDPVNENHRARWVALRRSRAAAIVFEGPVPLSMEPLYTPSFANGTIRRFVSKSCLAPGFGWSAWEAAAPSKFARFAQSVSSALSSVVSSKKSHEIRRQFVILTGAVSSGMTTLFHEMDDPSLTKEEKRGLLLPSFTVDRVALPGSLYAISLEMVTLQEKILPLFRHYFSATTALIVLISGIVRPEQYEDQDVMIEFLVREGTLRDVTILFLVTHSDLEEAKSAEEIATLFRLAERVGCKRRWAVFPCSLINGGRGVVSAMEWLAANRQKD